MIDEWERKSLKTLGIVITGSTPSTNESKFYAFGNISFFSPFDFNGNKYLNDATHKVTREGLKQSRKIPKNSIMTVCIGSTIGKIAISNVISCTNQQINTLIVNETNDYEFVFYSMSYSILKQLQMIMGLQAVPIVNKSAFEELTILLPKDLKEQQKIAKILTSVDESIEATNKIIAKQKRVKTALMQDLLTCGIDENGNIRSEETHEFKDSVLGRIPKEWQALELKNICIDFIVPMRDKPKIFKGNIPWCRIEDFNGKFLMQTKSNKYVDRNTIKQMNLKIHPIGTVLCSCSAVIGKTTIVKKPLVTNQTFIGLVPNPKLLNSEFLYYLLPTYIQRLENLSSGTTIVYLSREKFETFNVIVPLINEQENIAEIFSKQDEAIEQEKQKLHKLQRVKKALMQDLLTGKVRVNYE